ncbi:hypothetical protein ScPMuIL_004987 [Solemya velum]
MYRVISAVDKWTTSCIIHVINVVHVNATSKNAADDKLKQSLRRFADTHQPPAVIVLISSDVNFSTDLSDLRHRKKYNIILIHSRSAHEALLHCADELCLYEDLVKDLPQRTPVKNSENVVDLTVTGFCPDNDLYKVKCRLKQLSTNCGGRVIDVNSSVAVIRFTNSDAAARARKRIEGEDVYGWQIHVGYANRKQKSSAQSKAQGKKLQEVRKTPVERSSSLDTEISKELRKRAMSEDRSKNYLHDRSFCMTKTTSLNQSFSVGDFGSSLYISKDNGRQNFNQNSILCKERRINKPMTSPPIRQLSSSPSQQGPLDALPAKDRRTQHNTAFAESTAFLRNTLSYNNYNGHKSYTNLYQQQLYRTSPYNFRTPPNSPVQKSFFSTSSYNTSSPPPNVNSNITINSSSEVVPQNNNVGSASLSNTYLRTNPPPPSTYTSGSSLPLGEYQGNSIFPSGYHSDISTANSFSRNAYSLSPTPLSGFHSSSPSPHTFLRDKSPLCQTSSMGQSEFKVPLLSQPNAFRPIRSFSPMSELSSTPTQESESGEEMEDGQGPVELVVSNLDYNISAKEWRKIIFTTFHPHVKVLNVHVKTQPDNTSLGMVKLPTIEEARFAISQFHRKKIGYKRIHVTLKNDDSLKAATSVRAEAVALLSEAKGNVLPLFKFIELFDKRYHRSISVSELYKMKDTIEIREQGGAGRMVFLVPGIHAPTPEDNIDVEVSAERESYMDIVFEILEQPACQIHCPEGSVTYAEAVNNNMLPNVQVHLKTFSPQVHSLLMSHDGHMPLMSFSACYAAEFLPLPTVNDAVPLEHIISCVPGIQIMVSKTGVKKVQWAENRPSSVPVDGIRTNSPLLTQQLNQISREIIDLLKHNPHCRMPFSKFIPAYHHHFGRQCRVADYGYTKLMELFEAIPHVLQVLGTGDRKVLTLSHKAQLRRFTADLLRVLKAQPCKQISLKLLPDAFSKLLNKPWDVSEYGLCYVDDLFSEIPSTTVIVTAEDSETIVAIPHRDQTTEEVERTKQFSLEVVDLLKHNPYCRMPFNKFIPAYHHHFGHQCRVSDYGFTKLMDLFEAIPHVIEIEEDGEERLIHLTEPELRKVIGEQISNLLKQQRFMRLSVEDLMSTFTRNYGFSIQLHEFSVGSIEELLGKLQHVIRVEEYNGRSYATLANRYRVPTLAHRVLQLLMDQCSGSLPLAELSSRYKTIHGSDCDIKAIKEELLDFVQVNGDDEDAVISLTALQRMARDIRILLQTNGKIPLLQVDKIYQEHFGVEIKPALYGFPHTVALLHAIPHVVAIKGKGQRRVVQLSGVMCDTPPGGELPPQLQHLYLPRPGSSSNDSGITDTQDNDVDTEEKQKLIHPLEAPVPSCIPSPELRPEFPRPGDLISFDHQDLLEKFCTLSEDERKGQKTPLCRTPTSELLQLAAQCLITQPPPNTSVGKNGELRVGPTNVNGITLTNSAIKTVHSTLIQVSGASRSPSPSSPEDLLKLLQGGWWKPSSSQIEQLGLQSTDSVEPSAHRKNLESCTLGQSTDGTAEKIVSKKGSSAIKGDKQNISIDDNLNSKKLKNCSQNSVANSEDDVVQFLVNAETKTSASNHDCSSESTSSESISFDCVFRHDHPIDTSSMRSESSSVSDVSQGSPRKSPKKSRIAAKFNIPIDTTSAL